MTSGNDDNDNDDKTIFYQIQTPSSTATNLHQSPPTHQAPPHWQQQPNPHVSYQQNSPHNPHIPQQQYYHPPPAQIPHQIPVQQSIQASPPNEDGMSKERLKLMMLSGIIALVLFFSLGIVLYKTAQFVDTDNSSKAFRHKKKRFSKNKDIGGEEEEVELPEYEPNTEPIVHKDKSLLPDNVRHMLNRNIRSGKIDSKAQLEFLQKEFGIQRIVNLAHDSMDKQSCPTKDSNPKAFCEKGWAKELGLEFIYIPLGSEGPKDEDWMTIKNALLNGNTLVHCTHGADRTGAVVGRFILEETSADKETVYKEALEYGFKKEDFAYPGGSVDPNRHLREWMLKDD